MNSVSRAASIAKKSVKETVESSAFLDNAMVIDKGAGGSKYITYGERSCQNFVNKYHDKVYRESIQNQEAFFDREAQNVYWHKKYT